jgi:hypothetical protein
LLLFNMTSVHNSAHLRGELQESNICQRKQWAYRWFIRTNTVLYSTLSSNNFSRIDISVDNRACDETTFFLYQNNSYNILRFGKHYAEHPVYSLSK